MHCHVEYTQPLPSAPLWDDIQAALALVSQAKDLRHDRYPADRP